MFSPDELGCQHRQTEQKHHNARPGQHQQRQPDQNDRKPDDRDDDLAGLLQAEVCEIIEISNHDAFFGK